MIRVRTFYSSSERTLELKINEFIQNNQIEIMDIKLSVAENANKKERPHMLAMLIYKEVESCNS